MGLDFDVLEFCKKLKQERPPPYQCPLEKCDKVYKSLCGLQYHLVRYDHENPPPPTPQQACIRKKSGRMRAPAHSTADIALQSPPKEALTFTESQRAVQFEIDGKISSLPIDQPLTMISLEEWDRYNAGLDKPLAIVEPPPEPQVKLPEAKYKVIGEYNICDAPPRPNAYIRFIEKSAEELEGEVEYDADEEDTAWLVLLNKIREETGLATVSIDTFELLMDRLEKESYVQAAQSGHQQNGTVDEDAVCCICIDGECQNTNVILFCDMCNLPVHQDCYGVPYIPEGQWLCRRCLQSPSRQVSCVLCPNTGGAFKQTDQGRWAHVVCALWIPEVRFANTVFLEPIDCIEQIPAARWRLCCLVCKQRGAGACIQCNKPHCYAAFHVTCAQQAGLYMKMDAVGRGPGQPVHVTKVAYCDHHTPARAIQEKENEDGSNKTPNMAVYRQKALEKIRQARRTLALKRTTTPEVSIPTVTLSRACELASQSGVTMPSSILKKLLPYWTLKRTHRSGGPLLRRLQASISHSGRGIQDGSINVRELCNQLKYWQRIRQDLERARLLCELVRKRERVKAEYTRVCERVLVLKVRPHRAVLGRVIAALADQDHSQIFAEPVDPSEVPDYSTVVSEPMDLSTMSEKLEHGQYKDLDDIYRDFRLMINNCLLYNSKDTVFYKAGIKMRKQCTPVFHKARRDMLNAGLDEIAGETVYELDDDTPAPEPQSPASHRGRRTRERSVGPSKEFNRASSVSRQLQTPRELRRGSSVAKELPTPKKDIKRATSIAKEKVREPSVAKELVTTPTKESRRGGSIAKETKRSSRATSVLKEVKRGTSVSREVKEPRRGSSIVRETKEFKRAASVVKETRDNKSSRDPKRGKSVSSIVSRDQSPAKESTSASSTRELRRSRRSDHLKEELSQDTGDESDKANRGAWWWRTRTRASPADSRSTDSTGLFTANKQLSIGESSLSISGKSFGSDAKLPTMGGLHQLTEKKKGRGRPRKQEKDKDTSASNINDKFGPSVPASFREYRGAHTEAPSDTDNEQSDCWSCSSSLSCSSCTHYDHSSAESESDRRWSDDESRQSGNRSESGRDKHAALQFVWAKSGGYPWYPALIIDPKMPKGFVYNGIMLPNPPQDVLNMKKSKSNEPVLYLVLFFDAKRTWQWLPQSKLEQFGVSEIDDVKLLGSNKARIRKAVKKAYDDAVLFKKQLEEGA